MARKSRRTRQLRVVNPDCAGIDIGKDRHFVAVDPERSDEPVRSFGSFTRDLAAMAAWLASCGVTKVAMESTSVYRIAVYETLERAGFAVMLVPARMTKQIGGRKSDVLDCQWIWQLMTEGQDYVEQGIDAYGKRRRNRRIAHLDRQAQKLGFQLIPKTQGKEKENPMPSIA